MQVPVLMGQNSAEAIVYAINVLRDPLWLDVYNLDWEEYWGPIFIFDRKGNGDITPEDSEIARQARNFYFAPDGVIELDKLDRFLAVYTDSLFG